MQTAALTSLTPPLSSGDEILPPLFFYILLSRSLSLSLSLSRCLSLSLFSSISHSRTLFRFLVS